MLKFLFQLPECCLTGEKAKRKNKNGFFEQEETDNIDIDENLKKKWNTFFVSPKNVTSSTSMKNPFSHKKKSISVNESQILYLLCQVFSQKQQSSHKISSQIYHLYKSDPNLLIPYVPLISNYIMHGRDSGSKRELTRLMFQVSNENLHLAHLFYWRLQSNAMSNTQGTHFLMTNRLLLSIMNAGIKSIQKEEKISDLLIDESLKKIIEKNRYAFSLDFTKMFFPSSISSAEEKDEKIDEFSFHDNNLPDEFLQTPNFLEQLGRIGSYLRDFKDKQIRNQELKKLLTTLNEKLPANVYLPIFNRVSDEDLGADEDDEGSPNDLQSAYAIQEEQFHQHLVLRISIEESFSLHSNEWAPYHMCVEVLDCERSQPFLASASPSRSGSPTVSPSMSPSASSSVLASPAPTHPKRQMESKGEILVGNGKGKLEPLGENQPAVFDEIDSAEFFVASQVRNSFILSPSRNSSKNDIASSLSPSQRQNQEEGTSKILVPKGIFGNKSWKDIKNKVRNVSPYGHLPGWRLLSTIVKSCNDLKQEQFAAQLLYAFAKIFRNGSQTQNVWIKPFHVVAIPATTGLVETIPDAISIDSIKKLGYTTLWEFFKTRYNSRTLPKAQMNFVYSMVGYSLICYVLNIKDRHNANILIDSKGHVIHVDFGFFLNSSPGNVNLEPGLFKLNSELLEVMGGENSEMFGIFRNEFINGFLEIQKNIFEVVQIIKFSLLGEENLSMPCCNNESVESILSSLLDRLVLDLSEAESRGFANSLVDRALDNWRTVLYDKYQKWVVGVL